MPLWEKPNRNASLKAVSFFLLGTLVFALAYGQAPLYFSNQNQYFLHGLASAGYGHLDQDWLAQTTDPAPLFSLLVEFTYQYFGEYWFHIYYALLMGIYFVSLVGLFTVLAGDKATPLARLGFVALLLLVHSALARSLSARLLGVDYPWYFQAGVAGQYVLGPMLQPSAFGVLLLLSLYFFARGKPMLAVTCSSLGAMLHATYLLPAAMLTLSYMLVLFWERRVLLALLAGGWALVLVLPVVIRNFLVFYPSSPEDFARAQEILVHFRIPHHTLPQLWFDGIAADQVAWIALGTLLARGSRLFPVLLITSLLAYLLTRVQIATGSDALALLFPWRVSVILVPVATAIILTRLVVLVGGWFPQRMAWPEKVAWAGGLVVIVLVGAGGVVIMSRGLAFQERNEELAMMDFVYHDKSPGDVYLLPIPIPDLKSTVRGSFKSEFKPLPDLQKSGQFIPINLQRFRLYTGAPIFVDFKSIPYKDQDVLEWHRRLFQGEQFYDALRAGKFEKVLPALREQGITHIVTQAHQGLNGSRFPLVYEDSFYHIYQVPQPADK